MPSSKLQTVTVSVIGVSGTERVKGSQGVGKSLLCNRFLRGSFDDFHLEHSSILSQTDFGGSPVINNDHWLYWGERQLEVDADGQMVQMRVIEQTEFLDDESFEPIAGPSTSEHYCKRAVRLRLESRDKLMYIQKEQLGLEAEFPQQILPDGKCTVDGFLFVFDVSFVEGRPFEKQVDTATGILANALKCKRPLIIIASKMDSEVEVGRKALNTLLTRRELKGMSTTVIEVSSLKNVNVDESFLCLCQSILKTRHRTKVLHFSDAFRVVSQYAEDVRYAYVRLLTSCLPLDEWPSQRISWNRLLSEYGVDRHRDYATYVRIFGHTSARRLYEQHVNEAREHWMKTKLRSLLPSLPRVFSALLDRRELISLCWSEANERIHAHPLFDEFFQPLGALGKQLEPLSPEEVPYAGSKVVRIDQRIPAEILLRTEARAAYESYQQMVEHEQRKERLEEEFESLLAECSQVTPGRPLQEVCIFLTGSPAYDVLSPSQATLVYDRYQNDLVKQAEADFAECLYENIELFVEIVRRRRRDPLHERGFALTDIDLNVIRTVLQEDIRYRQLSRLWELRDGMIVRFASFTAHPLAQTCPQRGRCMDTVVPEQLNNYFDRRKTADPENSIHIVRIVVHGDLALVAQFITDMACALHGDPFQSAYGMARIHCIGYTGEEQEEQEEEDGDSTQLYLIDSASAIDSVRLRLSSMHTLSSSSLPPLYVLVCDPSHYEEMPFLHHQGALLADQTGGIFIGSGTAESDSGRSLTSDNSSIFGRDQLYRILDVACGSQLDGRRPDVRLRVSLLCADPFPLECFLSSLLSPPSIRPIVHPNFLQAGLLPLDTSLPSNGRSIRVDVRLGSYHSWIASRHNCPTHGHFLVYSARRTSSWCHTRAAICRILDDGAQTVTGRAIMIVAVADYVDNYNSEETSLLITEGRELAESIGASFIVISQEPGNPDQILPYIDFIDRIHSMVPLLNPLYGTTSSYGSSGRKDSDGYATLSEVRPTTQHSDNNNRREEPQYATYASSRSGGTMVSDSSSSRDSTLSSALYHQRAHTTTGTGAEYGSSGSTSAASGRISSSPLRYNNPPSVNRPPSGGSSTPSSNGVRSVRRRIAPAPPPPLFIPRNSLNKVEVAPLATPEMIDIAPDYAIVQDAEEHIYATLDHAVVNKSKDMSIVNGKKSPKMVKRAARPRAPSQQSGQSTEPISSPSTATGNSPSQPSSAGIPSPLFRLRPSPPTRAVTTATCQRNSLFVPTTATRPEPPPKEKRLSRPNFLGARSITMDFINRETFNKPRALKDVRNVTTPIRHSISVESLNAMQEENKRRQHKKKRTAELGFVRKVTSSFRFRGDRSVTGRNSGERAETQTAKDAQVKGVRSVPQSPQTERKQLKASCEKSSTAFSWLPSRSPKRNGRAASAELQPVMEGKNLEELAQRGGGVPSFISRCVHYIEQEGGLELEGLYRIPGNQSQLADVERQFSGTSEIDLSGMELPVHVVATALKNFFSQLSDPLIPHSIHDKLVECVVEGNEKETICRLQSVLSASLSPLNRSTLSFFLCHLRRVAASPATAMDAKNLSKVWWPTLFRPQFDSFDAMTAGTVRLQKTTEALFTLSHKITI